MYWWKFERSLVELRVQVIVLVQMLVTVERVVKFTDRNSYQQCFVRSLSVFVLNRVVRSGKCCMGTVEFAVPFVLVPPERLAEGEMFDCSTKDFGRGAEWYVARS